MIFTTINHFRFDDKDGFYEAGQVHRYTVQIMMMVMPRCCPVR